MSSKQVAAAPRDGLSLAPSTDEDDPGIHVRYPGLPHDQTVVLRTVLSSGLLEDATEAANKGGKYSNTAFRSTLFKGMILRCNVKDRAKDPESENPYIDPKDDATLPRLPASFVGWLTNEINRCDGSIAHISKATIAGREVDFRGPATAVD